MLRIRNVQLPGGSTVQLLPTAIIHRSCAHSCSLTHVPLSQSALSAWQSPRREKETPQTECRGQVATPDGYLLDLVEARRRRKGGLFGASDPTQKNSTIYLVALIPTKSLKYNKFRTRRESAFALRAAYRTESGPKVKLAWAALPAEGSRLM